VVEIRSELRATLDIMRFAATPLRAGDRPPTGLDTLPFAGGKGAATILTLIADTVVTVKAFRVRGTEA